MSVLHDAINVIYGGGNNEEVLHLIPEATDINLKDMHGRTLIALAVEREWGVGGDILEILKSLFEHSADANISDKDGMTPLHLAAKFSDVDVVKMLIDHGADINAVSIHRWTPLHYAICYKNTSVSNFLVTKCADVTIGDLDGRTAYSLRE